jgi:hypothetical protein
LIETPIFSRDADRTDQQPKGIHKEDFMPTPVLSTADIHPGEIYEDTFYHPCLCVKVDGTRVIGISLVDGSFPRTTDFRVTEVRKLTPEEAWQWRLHGPPDAVLIESQRWWQVGSEAPPRVVEARRAVKAWIS